jgi:hypothetical protein
MSVAMDFDTDQAWQSLSLKWQAAGHTVIHERATFRHKAYKKELDPDTIIMRDGAPFITNHGHTLTFKDLMPERADLCLDMDGNMLPQHEFEKRYMEFMNWFDFIEGSDPGAEHIPNAERWICQTPDTFSESPGMVEIGFDARKPAKEEATHQYDPVNDKMIEIMKANSEKADLTMEAVRHLLEDKEPNTAEVPKRRGPGRPRKVVDE